jgi:tetratricopeptide (TPR) repeat protein
LLSASPWAACSYAQTTPAQPAPTEAEAPRPLPVRADVARSLHRLTLLDLRAREQAGEPDFVIASELFARALAFNPGDTEILRRRIEFAAAANDKDAVIAATRELVRLDPEDTVATLRLINLRLASIQIVEDRLKAYARLLGPDGRSIDPGVRSRLALEAAALCQETGNERQFVEYLQTATELDVSNKVAAVAALEYFSNRVKDDPTGLLEMLANVLYADPLDAKAHELIRNVLARAGAFEQATRFHKIAYKIRNANNDLKEEDRVVALALNWRSAMPAKIARDLNIELLTMRDMQARRLKGNNENDAPVGIDQDLRPPESIRLSVPMEQIRVVAASQAQEAEIVRSGFADYAQSVEENARFYADPTVRDPNITQEEAESFITDLRAEHALWKLSLGYENDASTAAADALADTLPAEDPYILLLRAWSACRKGDPAAALAMIDDAEDTTPWSDLLRATVKRDAGDAKAAAEWYRRVEDSDPLSIIGAFAGTTARVLDPNYTRPDAKRLEAMARSIPTWIDRMVDNPNSFQSLTCTVTDLRAAFMDDVPIVVTLTNLAAIPLALGEQKPIDSRLFMSPRLDISNPQLSARAQGEELDAFRRLRLEPRQSVSATLVPESRLIGWVMGSGASEGSRTRWRVLQGIRVADNIPSAGPGCQDIEGPTIQKPRLPEATLEESALIDKLANASHFDVPKLLIAARVRLIQSTATDAPVGAGANLAEALARAYPTWPNHLRALAMSEIPPAGETPVIDAFDRAAKLETDPVVMPWVLISRVTAAEDPFLAVCKASTDAGLAAVAAAHEARIKAGGAFYAKTGVTGQPATENADAQLP